MKKTLFSAGLLIAISAAMNLLARNSNGFAQWYSECIYNKIVIIFAAVSGALPCSVAEVLLYACIFCLILVITAVIRRKIKLRKAAAGLILAASILLFLYTANCGINYYRDSFAECTEIRLDTYTTDDLAAVCLHLTEELNDTVNDVSRDKHGVMIHGEKIQSRARDAMLHLAEEYDVLLGYYPKPKELLIPWILSVQKITGIYSPFTVEANYNQAVTDYNVPFSACHELSHLRGFMQEEEANFIAYLACVKYNEIDFQYSGKMRGWISCMNLLYRTDPERWNEIRAQLHPAAEADLQANREFWSQYDGKIADYAEKVNDQYLKANGQNDGIQSYGRMADLIVAYYLNYFR